MKNVVGLSALAIAFLLGVTTPASAWTPPFGIPAPAFGINEVAPRPPNPWTTPTAGYYYVNWTIGNDSGNSFGTPASPRKTIPNILPAGAVVEVHGTYDKQHSGAAPINASAGTVDRPIFIRGSSASDRPRVTQKWEILGSYFIVENVHFSDRDGTIAGKITVLAPTNHAALRHNEFSGNLLSGGIIVTSFNTSAATHVVVYDNVIHDNGNVNATFDQDIQGISVVGRVNNLWVVDNEMYRNSGDGIQINGGTALQAQMHHIYVGRNVSHHNKQSGMWTKQAVDVIFSQNTAYGHRLGNSSPGACAGFQYAPERVWFLFNHLYDCDYGIYAGGNSGLGFGTESYFIGNVIHDIRHRDDGVHAPYNPKSGYSNAGIMLSGGVKRYILNNTIYDVDSGINTPGGSLYIVNNIIGNITEPQGHHVFVEAGPGAAGSTMHHNLYSGAVRIRWGANTVYNLPGFQAAFPGKGLSSLNASPLFVDANNNDFRLQAESSAVDAGTLDGVYATFFRLYGIDIAKDVVGTPRPQGSKYDLGAYEFTTGNTPSSAPPRPSAPAGLRVQ